MKQVKVRLSGIDSPEKGQPFAQGAKNKLSQLVFGKFVRVTGSKFDRYGRFLGKITRMDLDVNLEMINSGFAWHYKKYAREQSLFDRKRYSDAELLARRQMIGLWSEVNPVPPWDFRGVRRK